MKTISIRTGGTREGYKELAAGSGISIVENPTDVTISATGGGGGADIKSGNVSIVDGGNSAVTFATAFATTPNAVACFSDNKAAVDVIEIGGISTTGFTIYIKKGHGGQPHTHSVDWIATNAGDP
ncbi:hypothetical protein LCGC14_1747920 [marine sediment metagenome]|uniref:Major tropism determinant N-terminal domain-containing protein n=1 Tax=marine sediment metagenome TaxID=412755 RepID=A0A0F9K465_9ZZZZ